MQKIKISFRYKIQFAVLLLLSLTLGTYIWLASDTLLREKIASLLETSSASAEVLASRVSRKMLAQQYWIENALASDAGTSSSKFEHNSSLLSIVKKTGGQTEHVFSREAVLKQLDPPFSAPQGLSFLPGSGGKNFWLVKSFENGDILYSYWSDEFFAEEQRLAAGAQVFMSSTLNAEVFPVGETEPSTQALVGEIKKLNLPQSLFTKQISANGAGFILAAAPVEYFSASLSAAYPESLALEPVRELQFRSIYFAILVIGLTGLVSFWIGRALTQKLVLLTEETEKIAKGDLESAREIQTNDEIGDLSRSIVSMAKDLKRYIFEVSEKSRMEAELKTAKTVQEMLFPESSGRFGRFEVEGFYESASECGGDLWFYWKIDESLFFIVADATGHGAPAALITSAARSVLANAEYNRETRIERVAELLHHSVKVSSKGSILMTAFLGRLDLNSGELTYVNCSHEPPFMVEKDGKWELILGSNNSRLGDPDSVQKTFQSRTIKLEKGARLFVYTDGLTDMENPNGQRLSDRKFSRLVTESFAGGLPLKDGVQKMVGTLKDYSQHGPLKDDLTMVVIGQLD